MSRLERSPELSVVIPAYNAAETLGEQLGALAGQQATLGYEILVCDNGSTDNTAAVARAWQDRLPSLRVIDASLRRGPSAARNAGVREASGSLIAFCDADDVVGDGWLTAIHEGLRNADLVAGSLDGDRLNKGRKAGLSWATDGVYTKPFLPGLRAASTNNLAIRRAVFEELGGFEEALPTNEDTDLCWRVQLAGYRFTEHPGAVVHVRKRDGLRAVYRQAYSYGAGDRNLRYRYAHVIAAYAVATGAEIRAEPAPFDTENLRRRALAKARRVRRPADIADQVWRVGFWLGDRRGPQEFSIPQVTPPSQLPS